MKIDLITSCQRKAACMQNNIREFLSFSFWKKLDKKKKKKKILRNIWENILKKPAIYIKSANGYPQLSFLKIIPIRQHFAYIYNY